MKWYRWTLVLLGSVLLALSAWMVIGQIREDRQAASAARQVVQVLAPQIAAAQQSKKTAQEPADEQLPATAQTPDYILTPQMPMPEQILQGTAYIGILRIDALGLELPVIDSCTDENLRMAPCCFAGSAYLGPFVIAGHNYTQHFARLSALAAGDLVTFTDLDGTVFAYCVEKSEQLLPDDVDGMLRDAWDLTLFTCTIDRAHRIAVRCSRMAADFA